MDESQITRRQTFLRLLRKSVKIGLLMKPCSAFCLAAVLLIAVLSACSPRSLPGGPPQGVLPPTPAPTATRAAPLAPTASLPPSPTAAPTHTPTPTPTFTPTPTLLFMPQTPVPLSAAPITLERAEQTSGLAAWYETDVQALTWTSEGQALVVATSQSIHFVNITTQGLIRSLYPTLKNIVSLDFDPFGGWLVVGSRSGSEESGYISGLELWQGPNWRPRGVLYGTERPLTDLAFSPDNTYLAVAYSGPRGANSGVDLWYAPTWTISTTLDTGQALNLAFSPDGGLLAVSPDRYLLRVYNLVDRTWLYNLPTSFTGAVNALAFSPDGFTLASGHYDGTVRLWDMRSGDILVQFETGAVVQSLAFSPDGRILATGGSYENSLVRLWSVGSGVLLRELVGHTKGVTHLAFSPDSQFLVSASYDGMLRVWGNPPTP